MKVKEAKQITGSMTRTSKMPGLSYSLPAWECKTGAKLAKIKGSVCNGCYAMKGNYTRYPAIKAAQYVRLKAGALQISMREAQFLKLVNPEDVPDNLIIRMSSHMIDQGPVTFWPWTSTVGSKTRTCPAPDQGNSCGSCRACWNRDIPNIEYGKH